MVVHHARLGRGRRFGFGRPAYRQARLAHLARGGSSALYNTGFGILIAIPAMIGHRYLRARIDGYLHAMEQSAGRLARY
ncbi:MotA/TolQ/ExbB proton channel family protein, partial [Bordetella bronchiseptica]